MGAQHLNQAARNKLVRNDTLADTGEVSHWLLSTHSATKVASAQSAGVFEHNTIFYMSHFNTPLPLTHRGSQADKRENSVYRSIEELITEN